MRRCLALARALRLHAEVAFARTPGAAPHWAGVLARDGIRSVGPGAADGAWGESRPARRARYYRLTRAGHRQLDEATADWRRRAGAGKDCSIPALYWGRESV